MASLHGRRCFSSPQIHIIKDIKCIGNDADIIQTQSLQTLCQAKVCLSQVLGPSSRGSV